MFKLEFPSENKPLAAAIGRALLEYGTDNADLPANAPVNAVQSPVVEGLPADVVKQYVADAAPEDEAAMGNEPLGQSIAEQDAGAVQGATDASTVDEHGVPFNAAYCAKAAEPFYKSGKMAGQWKKKKGVDQATYDVWYASAKGNEVAQTDAHTTAETFDTSQAFGGQPAGQPAGQQQDSAPKDAGELVVWISEMQAAQHFNQDDVTQAYAAAGITAADVFGGPNANRNIVALYSILSSKVNA